MVVLGIVLGMVDFRLLYYMDDEMRMRRIHALQIAREYQRIENRKRKPVEQRKGFIRRLLNVK